MRSHPAKGRFLTFSIDSINKSIVFKPTIIGMVVIDGSSSLFHKIFHSLFGRAESLLKISITWGASRHSHWRDLQMLWHPIDADYLGSRTFEVLGWDVLILSDQSTHHHLDLLVPVSILSHFSFLWPTKGGDELGLIDMQHRVGVYFGALAVAWVVNLLFIILIGCCTAGDIINDANSLTIVVEVIYWAVWSKIELLLARDWFQPHFYIRVEF